MRMIIGLDRPTHGRRNRDHPAPLHEVGALLEARSIHKGRTARIHLLALVQTHGIPARRVEEEAGRRAGGFSLGMSRRLGVATVLLGDPAARDLERAGQRPGPGRRPLDPHSAEDPGAGRGAAAPRPDGRAQILLSQSMR